MRERKKRRVERATARDRKDGKERRWGREKKG